MATPRKLKVDFTGVESYIKCDEGEHIVKLTEVTEKTAESSGNEMLAVVFEVTKGSCAGARLFDNFVLTEKALWKLKSYLEVVGIKADGKIAINLDNLIGKTCIVTVSHEEYKGQLKARIDGYKKLGTSPAPAATPDAPAPAENDEEWEEA